MQAIILTIMLLFWFINYKNASCVRLHFGPHVRLHDFSCYDAVWLFNYDAVMQVLQMQEHAIFCVRWMLVHFTTLHFLRLQSACCFLISKNMQFFNARSHFVICLRLHESYQRYDMRMIQVLISKVQNEITSHSVFILTNLYFL